MKFSETVETGDGNIRVFFSWESAYIQQIQKELFVIKILIFLLKWILIFGLEPIEKYVWTYPFPTGEEQLLSLSN